MRKGFLYTVLALFMLNLVVLTTVLPLSVDAVDRRAGRVNVDELFYFLESVQSDIPRAVGIAARRAQVAVTNLVVNDGEPVTDADGKMGEAFLNGTIEGNVSELMADAAFRDWIAKMEVQAAGEGYSINMSVNLSTVRVGMASPFRVSFDFVYNLSVADPSIGTLFDRERRVFNGTSSILGIDDALIVLQTAGKRFNTYERCPSPSHASIRLTGTESEYNYTDDGGERSWTSGDAAVFNGSDLSSVDDPSSKVLVTEDLCRYSPSELDDFKGVVSEATTDGQDVCGSGEELPAYIGGVSNFSAVDDGRRLVMNGADVWRNSIPRQIESRCYFPDQTGPTFLDRLEGELTGTGNGVASFLNVPDLPSEVQKANTSAVDYVYFDDDGSYGTAWKIKGVSDHREWFRLDDDHVDRWNLNDLAYQ